MGKTQRKYAPDWEWYNWCRKHFRENVGSFKSFSKKYLKRDGQGKGFGFEYWSRRPYSGYPPGKDIKTLTNRTERRQAKREIANAEEA